MYSYIERLTAWIQSERHPPEAALYFSTSAHKFRRAKNPGEFSSSDSLSFLLNLYLAASIRWKLHISLVPKFFERRKCRFESKLTS